MNHLLIVMTAALTLGVYATDQDGPALTAPSAAIDKTDALTHQGVWKPIAAIMGGARVSPPALEAITLKVSGNNYEVTVEGETAPDRGTCMLDTTTNPKRMTIKSLEGPNQGKTFLAVYEMKDAGSLRVCYDLSGTDYPKEFKAPKAPLSIWSAIGGQKADAVRESGQESGWNVVWPLGSCWWLGLTGPGA